MNPLQDEVDFQKQALENGQATLQALQKQLADAKAAGASEFDIGLIQTNIDNQTRTNGFTQQSLNAAVAKLNGQTSVPTTKVEGDTASGQTAETELVNQGVDSVPAKGSIVSDTTPAATSRVRFASPVKEYDSETDTYTVRDQNTGSVMAAGLTEQEASISEQELSFQETDPELTDDERQALVEKSIADDKANANLAGETTNDSTASNSAFGVQTFDDGSSIQTFDDGSTLVTDSEGKTSATASTEDAGVAGATSKGGAVNTTEAKGTSAVGSSIAAPSYSPQTNPLHSYATYTYSISLFILSKDEFTTIAKNPEQWRPKNCLISSGGKHSTAFPRNPAFDDDFYFDNLSMTTVIGLNARSKGSNAIDIGFTIIEPMGLTLLNRIMDASISVNSPNYIEMPYLLQIDFYGNDDAGKLLNPIPGQSKRIPIRIIEIKTKVSTKGSEYAIKAVPFNHQALQETQATTPVNLEVDAATVDDFFKNVNVDITSQKKAKEDAQRDLVLAQGIQVDDEGNPLPDGSRGLGGDPEKAKQLQQVISAPYKANSYTGAVNAFYQNAKDTGACEIANDIKVVVDPSIAKSKIVAPKRTDIKKTPIPNPGTKEAQTVNKKGAAGPDVNSSSFAINSGTSVLRVIDMVMRNSDYITSQISDPAKNANKDAQSLADTQNKPMNWYKVVPELTLKEFDRKLNKWGITTTYHIKPYIVYNSKHPWGPQSQPKGAVKEYNYMYTGRNDDVISFDIDFDSLYYTAVSLNRSKYEALTTAQGTSEKETNNIPAKGGTNKPFTQKFHPRADDPGSSGMQGNDNSVTKTVNDIQNNIYSNSRGDMLNLKLKIIGDPQLIKQDDCYTNPGQSTYKSQTSGQVIPGNGSLVMDNGELYAKVSFKTPVDIDESTGLLRKNGKYVESIFSGMYKFLTVNNEFRGGKFEQTCDLIRMPDDVAGTGSASAPAAAASNKGVASKAVTSPERNTEKTKTLADTRDGKDASSVGEQAGYSTPAGVQTFDDGSSIQTFDDGSTLVTDSEGKTSATSAQEGENTDPTPAEAKTADLESIANQPGEGTTYDEFGTELNNSKEPIATTNYTEVDF